MLPVAARLRAKLLGNPPLANYASETVELAPAVIRAQPGAIALPNELNRVIDVQVETLGLTQITFSGGLAHEQLLRQLKTRDVFVFCHKIPESPRCLIEALQCGVPIVGYESAYPRDLIQQNGGGLLTVPNDPLALANELTDLAGDRPRLVFSVRVRRATARSLVLKALFNTERNS